LRDLFERLGVPILFTAIVVVTLATMLADRRASRGAGREHSFVPGLVLDAAAAIQDAVLSPVVASQKLWGRYVNLVGVTVENEQLRERLARLEEENLQFREALVASGHLQRIAEMRAKLETPLLPAEVVGRDVSPWFRSVLLDRGRRDGVRSGMPLLTERGLAGLVTATSRHASRAMLLTDRQSSVDGVVQRSRAQGIVRGRRGEHLEFEFAVQGSDVQVGDVVITSGVGGVYPKALQVGEVVEVGEAGELLQTALLRPSVDFGRLEGVFVMLWRAPTMELLYGEEGAAGGEAAADAAGRP
jgi:rod shape-determining protein MreC